MEYGLWLATMGAIAEGKVSLNPCSNGIWSLTEVRMVFKTEISVLILVLMEYGLWLQEAERETLQVVS